MCSNCEVENKEQVANAPSKETKFWSVENILPKIAFYAGLSLLAFIVLFVVMLVNDKAQEIRQKDYEEAISLGISPSDACAAIVSEKFDGQNKIVNGKETSKVNKKASGYLFAPDTRKCEAVFLDGKKEQILPSEFVSRVISMMAFKKIDAKSLDAKSGNMSSEASLKRLSRQLDSITASVNKINDDLDAMHKDILEAAIEKLSKDVERLPANSVERKAEVNAKIAELKAKLGGLK